MAIKDKSSRMVTKGKKKLQWGYKQEIKHAFRVQ